MFPLPTSMIARLLLFFSVHFSICLLLTDAAKSTFISGSSLGTVRGASNLASRLPSAADSARNNAEQTITAILLQHRGGNGTETIKATAQAVTVDETGNLHVRFKQYLQGLPIDGASLMMHLKPDGTVYAVNGEFTAANQIDTPKPNISCVAGVVNALTQVQAPHEVQSGTWLTSCQLSAVQSMKDSTARLAYKRMIGWEPKDGNLGPQKAYVFASTVNGDLLAFQPKTYGARSVATYDCHHKEPYPWQLSNCALVSNSSNPISSDDDAANFAHNNSILTYDFFKEQFGRKSFDNADTTLISFVHYGVNFSKAGEGCCPTVMAYGDGDGVTLTYFSRALDVVAHEIAHAVTESTSYLWYVDESGAINEAFSDIIGAAVERVKGGKDEEMVWELGEDLNLVDKTKGIRNMADPQKYKSSDFYFDRYRGWMDNYGVHWNSGIMNLAFYLMVKGGTHPRRRTDLEVKPLDVDFDASLLEATKIFYFANIGCLTENSDFRSARECTLLFAGSAGETVAAAWDAVGVRPLVDLQDGVPLTNQVLYTGGVEEYEFYTSRGYGVECKSYGTDGDADLYIRMYTHPEPYSWSSANDCSSDRNPTSQEVCYMYYFTQWEPVYVMLKAFKNYSDVTLTCTTVCQTKGQPCWYQEECCIDTGPTAYWPLTCDGPDDGYKVCKRCKNWNKSCIRHTECCSGYCGSKRCW